MYVYLCVGVCVLVCECMCTCVWVYVCECICEHVRIIYVDVSACVGMCVDGHVWQCEGMSGCYYCIYMSHIFARQLSK